MARVSNRQYSRYALEALSLLGSKIRVARLERRWSAQNLAERAGISRDLLFRIEKGDPRCEIGVVFELASILRIPLFAPELAGVREGNREISSRLALMPKAIRPKSDEVDDDF